MGVCLHSYGPLAGHGLYYISLFEYIRGHSILIKYERSKPVRLVDDRPDGPPVVRDVFTSTVLFTATNSEKAQLSLMPAVSAERGHNQ